MQFGFLGIDYKNADLAVRDEISFTDQKKMEFYVSWNGMRHGRIQAGSDDGIEA